MAERIQRAATSFKPSLENSLWRDGNAASQENLYESETSVGHCSVAGLAEEGANSSWSPGHAVARYLNEGSHIDGVDLVQGLGNEVSDTLMIRP